MEFTKEQVTEIGLSEEQVAKVQTLTNDNEATLKQDWDTKATTDAENILHSATEKVVTLTGIQHEKGQKIADYLTVATESYVKGQKASLERKQTELQDKIDNHKGDDVIKAQLEETKEKLDVLKQHEAKWDDYEKNDYKTKYETATQDLSKMQLRIAFDDIKPSFPETVNKFESRAKWEDFMKRTLENYDIELDENNQGVAIDKENKHKVRKLSELVKEDTEISELTKGHTPTGSGAKPPTEEFEGVPFKVAKDATREESQKAIKYYLINDLKLDPIGQEYAKKFQEYNIKLLEKTPKQK